MSRNTVADAHRDLKAAEQKVRDAERERDEARARVDMELAERGWRRAAVAAAPGVSLYQRLGSNLVEFSELIEHETRAAA